jgi:hypothetical protein
VRIAPAAFTLPPTPPPDIDLEAWERTIAEIGRRAPDRLALTHFGVFDDVERQLAELRERLARWAGWVRDGLDREQFVAAAEAELPPGEVEHYEHAVPPWQCYLGLRRYWDKRLDPPPGP